jgi:hypothetical protein
MAGNAGNALGNGLSRAGDAIENTARSASNEVREAVGGERDTNTNKTGR